MAAQGKRGSGGSTPAVTALNLAGVSFSSHLYVHDPRADSFGIEAAEALGADPARVFKTLMVNADGELAVGIVSVDLSLDLKAVSTCLGAKRAQMADIAQAMRATGYVAGGISPIGQKRAHRTVIDESAHRWDTVYVSGGRRGFDIELAPRDLITMTNGIVAAISR